MGQGTRSFGVEILECRRMLSAVPQAVLDDGFEPMQWRGDTVYAKPGQWLLQLDGVIGDPEAQVAKANGQLGRINGALKALKHLGRDGLFLLEAPKSDFPMVHLFDEPQFNTQDGYIGFMLDFFRRLRAEGRVVFLCVHPNEPFHLEILRETCERFLFVHQGTVAQAASFGQLLAQAPVRGYLGALAPA